MDNMFDTFGFSEGGSRSPLQDVYAIHVHPADSSCVIAVVADGQGGSPGSAEAAQVACQSTIDLALARSPEELCKPATWIEILRLADAAVHRSSEAGYSTLVGVCVSDGSVVGASSGDSAAFAVTADGPLELTSGQAKNPPVGSGLAEFVPFVAELTGPWRVFLMTDGVWTYAGREPTLDKMAHGRGPEVMESLKAASRLPTTGRFPHDFTAVLIQA